jgi:hypothetical protein
MAALLALLCAGAAYDCPCRVGRAWFAMYALGFGAMWWLHG